MEQAQETTKPPTEDNEKIKLTIKQLDGETFDVEVMKDASILGLKLMISQIRNLPVERQRLIFRAQELRNNESVLSQYGLVNGSVIHIVIRPIANVDAPPIDNNVVMNMPYPNADDEGLPHQFHDQMNPVQYDPDIFYWVRICRFIKIMALINAMFLFILGFGFYQVFILSFLSLTGYIGAKYLKRHFLFLYLIFLILDIGLRIYFIYIYKNNGYEIVFLAIIILFDLFLFKCTVKLYRVIPLLTNETKNHIITFNRVGFF